MDGTPLARIAHAVVVALVTLVWLPPALALEERKDEKDKLKSCERSLCQLVTRKAPVTGNLTCGLSKTWSRDKIKQGSAGGKIGWTFGDARCSVDLSLPRATVVAALKETEYTLQFPEHWVSCEVERDGSITNVRARLSPKVAFKNGAANKVWVNLKEVDGPGSIKGLALTAAKLHDGLGVFQKGLLKNLNYMIGEKCPSVAAGK